jgi:hypothetical protein
MSLSVSGDEHMDMDTLFVRHHATSQATLLYDRQLLLSVKARINLDADMEGYSEAVSAK